MSEATVRARLVGEGLSPNAWGDPPHETYAPHRHAYDKVLVAAEGSITFHLTELDRDVHLETGDRLELPAGALHSADVGPDGVTCLEAHVARGSLGPEPRRVAGWDVSGAEGTRR